MLSYLPASIVLAFGVSAAVCRTLIETGPRDVPGEARKVHVAPTPTSGGLAVAAGVVAGLAWMFQAPALRATQIDAAVGLWPLVTFPLGFLLIGFLDDARALAAHVKAPIFVALSIGGAASAGAVQSFPLGVEAELGIPVAIGLIGTALWIFTLVNAVNFIDGANGVASGSMAIALSGLAAIAWLHGEPVLAGIAICATAGIAGFLIWNFPRGRIFAGDAGALSLGAFAAVFSLALVNNAGISPAVPAILFFPILADVLLTMLWRARRGAPLMQAHADHLYQIALRAWRSHVRVAVAFWGAMTGCAALAILVALHPDPSLGWMTLAALSVCSVAASELARRLQFPLSLRERG